MKYLPSLIPVILCCSLCSSCSYLEKLCWWQQSPSVSKGTKKSQPPLYLGTVHQVYAKEKFVLLRIIGPIPKAGVTLISHPVDGSTSRMGNLVVSEDSAPLKGMVVADIRSGSIASGDRVFLYRDISPAEESEEKKLDVMSLTKKTADTAAPQIKDRAEAQDKAPQAAQTSAPRAAEAAAAEKPAPEEKRRQGPAPIFNTSPNGGGSSGSVPSHINDIPEDINQWN